MEVAGFCWMGGFEEQRDVMETGWVRGTCGLAGQRCENLKPLNGYILRCSC